MVKADVKAIAGWCFLNFASSYSFFLFHPYPFWPLARWRTEVKKHIETPEKTQLGKDMKPWLERCWWFPQDSPSCHRPSVGGGGWDHQHHCCTQGRPRNLGDVEWLMSQPTKWWCIMIIYIYIYVNNCKYGDGERERERERNDMYINTLHYITLHYTTLHYITLHYIYMYIYIYTYIYIYIILH